MSFSLVLNLIQNLSSMLFFVQFGAEFEMMASKQFPQVSFIFLIKIFLYLIVFNIGKGGFKIKWQFQHFDATDIKCFTLMNQNVHFLSAILLSSKNLKMCVILIISQRLILFFSRTLSQYQNEISVKVKSFYGFHRTLFWIYKLTSRL